MRYKAAYWPSELLCPLRYSWVPFNVAKPQLDERKYVVLSDYKDEDEKPVLPPVSEMEDRDIGKALIGLRGSRLRYKDLQGAFGLVELEAQVQRYVRVVGRELSERMVYSLEEEEGDDDNDAGGFASVDGFFLEHVPADCPVYAVAGQFSTDEADGPVLPPPMEMQPEEQFALREWRM